MFTEHRKVVFRKMLMLLCVYGMMHVGVPEACSQDFMVEKPPQVRSVVDMTGRRIILPDKINRVATIGAVPVINSYIFALGEGKKIANGLPYFAQTSKWWMQTIIAPHLADRPVVQGQRNDFNIEALIKLDPDVIIAMGEWNVNDFQKIGIPVILLQWRNTGDIKDNMRLLDYILNCMERSDEYIRYVENMIGLVQSGLDGIPLKDRPKVLYFSPGSLTTPHLIADWWIEEAGGRSVTSKISRIQNISYSHEHVLLWNPDIMIVPSHEQIKVVYSDNRFLKTSAVINKKVYAIPVGVHPWGQRTVEQPLTVLWAAKTFFPDHFKKVNMIDEIRKFYQRFF